jgi:subtilisin family serine protease
MNVRHCCFIIVAAAVLSCPLFAGKPLKSQPNPLGVVMVRFRGGVSAATARNAVTAAGGQILQDLTAVHAIAALPGNNNFIAAMSANPNVQAIWADRVSAAIPGFDVSSADAGVTGKNEPPLGNPGAVTPPDPWHNATSFLGETNPEGILQWDDNRMNVPAAWATTLGKGIRVAVIDSGVQGSHKELLPNYDNQTSANMIPCNLLTRQFGPLGKKDCTSEDTEGHGTWVASRIAGAANGFASNGIAPNAQIIGYKALSTPLGGGLTSWIVAGMIDACNHGADIINMSLGGYDDLSDAAGKQDFLLWVDAVNYCHSKGTTVFASAGNDHVRINRVTLTIDQQTFAGVGQVDSGPEGYASVFPGDPLSIYDLRGLVATPGGVPGVIMVSATNNAISPGGPAPFAWPQPFEGKRDQLTYYSNYGSRIDLAAPGGARKFNIPRYDGGNSDILFGGWGILGALDPSGEICTDPSFASLLTFACFKVQGSGFGWLQGTSMSSPNAVGVAALTLAAHPELRGNPDGLLARLAATARTDMVNYMGPNDPANTLPDAAGVPCGNGFCHINESAPIAFTDAYGAGIVNAAAAVAP